MEKLSKRTKKEEREVLKQIYNEELEQEARLREDEFNPDQSPESLKGLSNDAILHILYNLADTNTFLEKIFEKLNSASKARLLSDISQIMKLPVRVENVNEEQLKGHLEPYKKSKKERKSEPKRKSSSEPEKKEISIDKLLSEYRKAKNDYDKYNDQLVIAVDKKNSKLEARMNNNIDETEKLLDKYRKMLHVRGIEDPDLMSFGIVSHQSNRKSRARRKRKFGTTGRSDTVYVPGSGYGIPGATYGLQMPPLYSGLYPLQSSWGPNDTLHKGPLGDPMNASKTLPTLAGIHRNYLRDYQPRKGLPFFGKKKSKTKKKRFGSVPVPNPLVTTNKIFKGY